MKTAIQELIERLKINIEKMPNEKNYYTQGYKAGLSFVIECATNSLEKEKEHICDAYVEGLEGLYMGAEEYYNQTYNNEIL